MILVVATVAVAITIGVGGSTAAVVNNSANTTTPIKHVVVIFDENETFDHYFGTYPYAANTDGTNFTPAAGTPGLPGSPETVSTELSAGLVPDTTLSAAITNPNDPSGPTIVPNPNTSNAAPNPNEYQPQRLTDTEAVTCDNNHDYGAEEAAVDGGKMDQFVQTVSGNCNSPGTFANPGLTMDYYDGNTVTALWNYAQNYSMDDNAWDATFGPSTPGALNLVAGNTYSGSPSNGTIDGDIDPNGDQCGTSASVSTPNILSSQQNIGDVLNADGVTWGWFEGGFNGCPATRPTIIGTSEAEYVPHHDPFQYFASTANWDHLPPANDAEVGFAGSANHQYGLAYFNDALNGTGGATLPAVSFLKAPQSEDGHPASSDPLDEQKWLTATINSIEQSSYWPSTAIIVTYDDSDGWYDHQAPTITNSSDTASDSAICTAAAAAGVPESSSQADRCGPSQRIPFLVISPYAKQNYVDHTEVTQPSILKFIEQNWTLPSIGGGSFDASAGSIMGMFDWQAPQQREVLLDQDCNTTVNVFVSGTCNNTAAADNINGDAGFGAVASTPAASVPVPPVLTVGDTTPSFPVGSSATAAAVVAAAKATVNAGTVSADLSSVNFAHAGTYTATITGSDNGVPAMNPATITVDVTQGNDSSTQPQAASIPTQVNAEQVQGSGSQEHGGGTAANTGARTPHSSPRVKLAGASRYSNGVVRLTVDAPSKGAAQLTLRAATGHRTIRVVAKTLKATRAGAYPVALTVGLGREAKLARAHAHLILTVAFKPASGKDSTVRRTLTVATVRRSG